MFLRSTLLLLVATLAVPTTHEPRASPVNSPARDGKSDFDALLQQVRRSMDAGRFKEAKELLLAKLAEHKDQAYVRARLEEIEAALKTCSFQILHPRKKVGDVLGAEVGSYDTKTGQISLTWRKPSKAKGGKDKEAESPTSFPGDDFETVKGDHVLKLPFVGPFHVQFTGKALGQTPPLIRLCIRDEDWYEVELNAGDLSRLVKVSGETRTTLVSTSSIIINVARPYVLKYTVRDAQIEGSFKGSRIVLGDKDKDAFGQLSYRNVAQLERVDVAGRASRDWIEARLDEIAERELAEFEKTYDPVAALPDWLR